MKAIDYDEVGRRIAARRRFLGLKQAQVCEMCDLSDKYLSGIERARSIPSLDVLFRISEALDTTPDAFLLGTRADINENLCSEISQQLIGLNNAKLKLVASFIGWVRDQAVE